VPQQCGFCQSGMLMAAAALLAPTPEPTEEQIRAEITNICRCGTYKRVLAGIKRAAEGGPAASGRGADSAMTMNSTLSRRGLVATASAAASASTLGFHVPLTRTAAAQGAAPAIPLEINAWVVIRPDDTVVIRIARSEMGQGTLTGLARLVAE
jgi:xanthine dehydrogenase iron-sulfur cluster and FAD-binding subunit A